MPYRTFKTDVHDDDRNSMLLASLFGFSALLLAALAVVPEPAAILPIAALVLKVQLTRLLGTRLFRDFVE